MAVRKLSMVSIALIFCCHLSCASRTFHQKSASIKGNETLLKSSEFKLAFAEENNIDYRVVKVDFNNPDAQPESRHGLRIEFPQLTKNQYDLLMERYRGQGLVPFDKNRSYELVDFLPPKLQALVNRGIQTSSEPEPRIPLAWHSPTSIQWGEDKLPLNVGIDSNCWSMTYEVVRDLGTPIQDLTGMISYFGVADFEEVAWNQKKHQELVEELPRTLWTGAPSGMRVEKRRLGDVLQIRTNSFYEGVVHTAVYIDVDLYFEKTNAGKSEPMRLATFSSVVAPYISASGESLPVESMQFVRYKENSLPPPTVFAGKDHFIRPAPLPPLPSQIADEIVFALDLGGGGALSQLTVRRIKKYKVVQDSETRRAKYLDAEKELFNFPMP